MSQEEPEIKRTSDPVALRPRGPTSPEVHSFVSVHHSPHILQEPGSSDLKKEKGLFLAVLSLVAVQGLSRR